MQKAKEIIKSNIQGKKVLLLFILTNVIYALMLIVTIPRTMTFSNGMKLLDMMPKGYDGEYINTLFQTLGEKGREIYLFTQLPVDMIYPFLFAVSYSLLIAYFLKKLNKIDSPFFYLCFLPILAGIADYSENIGIITMLNSYPQISSGVAWTTNISSLVKSMATTIYFVSLLFVLLALGVASLNKSSLRIKN